MPVIPVKGPDRQTTGIPSSAFSKGDLLMYDSNSSLSRYPANFPVGELVGVALADSTESLDNQVPYAVALPSTAFYAQAAAASQMTRGESLDMAYAAGSGYSVVNSRVSPLFIIDFFGGTEDVRGQSDLSRVIGHFDQSYLRYGGL